MKVVMANLRVYPFGNDIGGGVIYPYFLAKHLVREGIEVNVYTSTPQEKANEIFKGIKYRFIRPYIPAYSKMGFFLYYIFSFNLGHKLKRNDFDVFHSFGMTSYMYLRNNFRKPVIVQPFGIYGETQTVMCNKIKRAVWKITGQNMLKYCLTSADAIATEGDNQANELSNAFHIPLQKFFNLPDGVETETIEKHLLNSKITKEELGLHDADLVLVNVNRLSPNKGINYLIDALKLLNNEMNVKLILIGSGPEEKVIKQKIMEHKLKDKVVHFKDISDERKFQLISLADISITPTLYEGLPIVILEAMACGKPIVASNVAEVPQVVKHGVNGFLVPPRDPEVIKEAVLEIYDKDLIKKFGKASKRIVKNYDWSNIAKMAMRAYERVCDT